MEFIVDISPCPNDTFMFDAMLHGRIDTGGLRFVPRFADIEQLNAAAIAGRPDITKMSYGVSAEIAADYLIMGSGSALGRGNGPLLVCKRDIDTADPGLKIAVPGLHTTANQLIGRLFPALTDRTPVLFSEIASRVASGEFDAGVLIHEGHFTYRERGLKLVADLGLLWEKTTGMPLPLGGIVVSRRIPRDTALKIEEILRRSVRYALEHPEASREFVAQHAQELSESVTKSHIELFVNEFSLDLGREGRRAVQLLTGQDAESIFL